MKIPGIEKTDWPKPTEQVNGYFFKKLNYMVLTRDNIPHSGNIYLPEDIGYGYNFKANIRCQLKYDPEIGVYISVREGFLNHQQFILSNGEVTADILAKAIYEA